MPRKYVLDFKFYTLTHFSLHRFAAETKTSSGIIIPDTAKEKPQKGTVVAVGPGTKENPVTVKVGNKVLYGKYAGTELQLEGVDYLIMKENDILAIV